MVGTGETVYEQILSLDIDLNPVTATTFDTTLYLNGSEFTASTVNVALSDAPRGVFSASWSSATVGVYQLYVKNAVTEVVFVSDMVDVGPEMQANIYVGI